MSRPQYRRSRRPSSEPPPILVVDDDPQIASFVSEALEDEGYAVLTAENGAQALDRVGTAAPALILLDLRMPVMNGPEFIAAYRRRPGPHAPIIVVTAAPDPHGRAAACGADDVLPKPFELDDLLACVERYIRR